MSYLMSTLFLNLLTVNHASFMYYFSLCISFVLLYPSADLHLFAPVPSKYNLEIMTIIVEDSEEIQCSQCDQLRRTFTLIGLSAILPMIFFAALLLITVTSKLEPDVENATSLVVEFVFGLLYVQLFVATSILIISFLKRRHPTLKYHYWYFYFHIAIMSLFLCSCFIMTAVNESYGTLSFVCASGVIYFYILYNFMDQNKNAWTTLRRAY